MNWEVWGPPIIVVGTGLVAGFFVALRLARASEAELDRLTSQRIEDLQARKQALVEQLRGLETDRRKLSPDEFQQRWRRTLDKAARTLRDLDLALEAGAQPAPATAGSADVQPAARSTRVSRKGVIWMTAAIAFFALLGLSLTQTTKPRGDGGMTGMTVDAGQARLEAAQAALAANPQDLDAAAYLAHVSIRAGDLQGGMKYVDAGREIDPDDPRIQASLGALMIAIGYNDRAAETLDAVHAAAPQLATGWLWRGVLEMSRGDKDAALSALDKVLTLSEDAEDKRLAAQLISDLKTMPMAQPGAAAGPAGTPGASAGGGTLRIKGQVRLAEGVELPAGALVFIYARTALEGRGPPLAALKLSAADLPLDFEITDGDIIMQGMPWPDQVWISARVDLDGNAATKEEGAPSVSPVGPLESGSEDISLLLE